MKPDFAPAHNNIGWILAKTGHIDDAIAVYNELLDRFGTADEDTLYAARALYNIAIDLRTLERSDDAIAIYDNLVKRFDAATEPDFHELVAHALSQREITRQNSSLAAAPTPPASAIKEEAVDYRVVIVDPALEHAGDVVRVLEPRGKGVSFRTVGRPSDAKGDSPDFVCVRVPSGAGKNAIKRQLAIVRRTFATSRVILAFKELEMLARGKELNQFSNFAELLDFADQEGVQVSVADTETPENLVSSIDFGLAVERGELKHQQRQNSYLVSLETVHGNPVPREPTPLAGTAAQSRPRSALHVPEAGHEATRPAETQQHPVSAEARVLSELPASLRGRGYVKRDKPEDPATVKNAYRAVNAYSDLKKQDHEFDETEKAAVRAGWRVTKARYRRNRKAKLTHS